MYSVLFVCTANICRSPMAMGLMQNKVRDSINEWRIESAGTWAINGEPAAINTIKVLEERGIDINSHRSRLVTLDMMRQFKLILTMERGHKEALQVEFPAYAGNVLLLSELVDGVFDVHDPIGGPLENFQETAKEIEQILSDGFENISNLSWESSTASSV